MNESLLIFATFDERDAECWAVHALMQEHRLLYTKIPVRGIEEPQVIYRSVKYDGLDAIRAAVESGQLLGGAHVLAAR